MDLTLVTLDELLDEIRSRCDCGVIVLQASRGPEEDGLATQWFGDPFTDLGLLDYMRGLVKRSINSGMFEKDEL
jgi:hypothetical protein